MRSKKRKKKKSGSGKICICCIALAVMVILSVQIVRLYHQDQEYQQEQQELEDKTPFKNPRNAEQQRSEDLEEQQEYVGTDQYVEDVARSKLGMVYQDEILFKEE